MTLTTVIYMVTWATWHWIVWNDGKGFMQPNPSDCDLGVVAVVVVGSCDVLIKFVILYTISSLIVRVIAILLT